MSIDTRKNLPALSETQQKQLKEKHIAIIGCCTTGSWIAECLVRAGAGRLTIVEPQELKKEDGNRSLLCQPDTIGEDAAFAAKRRIAQIAPD